MTDRPIYPRPEDAVRARPGNELVQTSVTTIGPHVCSEAVCPRCGEVTLLRHAESAASPFKIETICRHARATLWNDAGLFVEFGTYLRAELPDTPETTT